MRAALVSLLIARRFALTVLVVTLFVASRPIAAEAQTAHVAGVVHDSSGAVVTAAQVLIVNTEDGSRWLTQTDGQGRFALPSVPRGSYVLVVSAHGFATRRMALGVGPTGVDDLNIGLEVSAFEEEVTVTATRGMVLGAQEVSQPVNIVESDRILQRAKSVVAQVATEEVGVQLQRTSPTVAGIFVRGLTGNKVNVYVDGVRFSNAAARGGINSFLDLIEPSALEAVEILRGPTSAQYGSDAIGGSVQFITRVPPLRTDGPAVRGSFGTLLGSADRSFGSHVTVSYSAPSFALLTNLAGRRVNALRPGKGIDSHAAVTRFFGLKSDLFFGPRLPDTGFTQYGGGIKANWAPTPLTQIIAQYNRSSQGGGRRYDQLLGGDGNLVADLRAVTADLFYLKLNRSGLGWFDRFSATYSLNAQREERVNQGGNGNPMAAVNHEPERTTAHGIQVYGSRLVASRHTVLIGGELYPESVRSPSFAFDPATGISAPRRPRVPDKARYTSGGLYVQDVYDAMPGRLRLVGNLRYSAASYRAREKDSPLVDGHTLWPDDALNVSNVTFRAGAVVTLSPTTTLSTNASRGFRAPHITDLGTLGLTGSGFEVAAPDVADMGATIGTTADSRAVSTGRLVRQVEPETSFTYELAAHYRGSTINTSLSFFVNNIYNNIAKQSLILPPGAVGLELGGQSITTQPANGVVFVSPSTNPVLVRTNYDNARIYGIENTIDWRISATWSAATVFTYLRAKDTRTGLAPNIEGGTPAPEGYLRITYAPAGQRYWVEPYLHASARQARLSSLDLEDRRNGATRSHTSIRNFFQNGATARGWVAAGPDGAIGTPDDVLTATGETLAQIQQRVLGAGVQSAPTYTAVPGYLVLSVRAGIRFGAHHEVVIDADNLTDRNYRGISWGVDAPGRGVSVMYLAKF